MSSYVFAITNKSSIELAETTAYESIIRGLPVVDHGEIVSIMTKHAAFDYISVHLSNTILNKHFFRQSEETCHTA
jgi:predicted transcriptional regulator